MPIFTARKRPDGVMAEIYIYLGKTTIAQRNRIKHALEEKTGITRVEVTHSTFLSAPAQPTASSKPMFLSNPYGPRLAEGSRFYGREVEYERIALCCVINRKVPLSCSGVRSVLGKHLLCFTYKNRHTETICQIYMDLQGKKDGSTTQFLYELMTCIQTALRDDQPRHRTRAICIAPQQIQKGSAQLF